MKLSPFFTFTDFKGNLIAAKNKAQDLKKEGYQKVNVMSNGVINYKIPVNHNGQIWNLTMNIL